MRRHPKKDAMNNSRHVLFLVSLLTVWAGLAMNGCSKTADNQGSDREIRPRDYLTPTLMVTRRAIGGMFVSQRTLHLKVL